MEKWKMRFCYRSPHSIPIANIYETGRKRWFEWKFCRYIQSKTTYDNFPFILAFIYNLLQSIPDLSAEAPYS